MKYISLNWTLALKFSIGKKKRMRDCRILMAHDCIFVGNKHSRSDSFNLIHVNIRGLETHFNDFLTFLSSFDFVFDVICLSEAHLCMDKTYLDSDRFHINNYTLYKTFSTIKYGGCIVYVRDTYNTNKVQSLCGSNSISDYLYVNISIPGSAKPLYGYMQEICNLI